MSTQTHDSAQATINADQAELDKFAALASRWWDPESEFKPLHAINPLRLEWIQESVGSLAGKKVLDVGCGGGILSEAMARAGAEVTGIDLADKSLKIAKLHGLESGVKVEYRKVPVNNWRPSSRANSTWSPAWKCWNTCRTRPPLCAPARR